ncbi:MAG: hypothetical protein IJ228_05320 [Succinivibrio sp.]|nr:hypothetical protein [Succinivibrio sp.]
MSDIFSLRDFNLVSMGEYNAGQVDIVKDKQGNDVLSVANSHVSKTKLNNVVFSEEKVLRIKEAFISALQRGGVTEEKIAEIRARLGIPSEFKLGADGLKTLEQRIKPLTRDEVRQILDTYAKGGRGYVKGSNEVSHYEAQQAFRAGSLSGKAAAKRDAVNQANLKLVKSQNSFAQALDVLTMSRSLEAVHQMRCAWITGEDKLNQEMASKTALINNFKNLFTQVLSMQSPDKFESAEFTMCGQSVKLVKGENGEMSAIVGKGTLATRVSLHATSQQMMERLMGRTAADSDLLGQTAVKQLLNKVYDRDLDAGTLTSADKTSLTRQFATLICAVKTNDMGFDAVYRGNYNTGLLVEIAEHALDGKVATAEQVKALHEKMLKDNAGLSDEMKQMLASVANVPLGKPTHNTLFEVKAPIVDDISKVAQNTIPPAPPAPVVPRDVPVAEVKNFVADLIFSDEVLVADVKVNRPGEVMRGLLTDEKNIRAFIEIMKNPDVLDGTAAPEVAGILKEGFSKMREIINEKFLAAEGRPLDEAASDPRFVAKLGALLKDADKLPGAEIAKFDAIIQSMANRGCEATQTFINEIFKIEGGALNAQGGMTTEPYKNLSAEQIKAQLDGKNLNQILDDANSDASVPGQVGLFKQVLSDYFTSMGKADKRSAFSAALRYAQPFEFKGGDGQPLEGEALESAKNAALNKYAGAILKGAGPLLQKMMQGLPKNVMGGFADALDDMKSNLAPIPRKIVQAHLMKMINDSQGKITDIKVERSLGAASVGEVFLCNVSYTDAQGKKHTNEAVVKIMRHDAEQRVQREAELFTAAAAKIGPGMAKTWEGQLGQYLKEFDFTLEADNIKAGAQIYNVSSDDQHPSHAIAPDVGSMTVSDLIPPTKNALVASKASGKTLDRFFNQAVTDMQQKVSYVFKRDPATGKLQWDPETKKPIFREDANQMSLINLKGEVRETVDDLYKAQDKLQQASRLWFREALFGSGQFHGDCHAGNLMVTNYHVDFIDFGNLYKLETRPALGADGAPLMKDGQPVMVNERQELLRMIMGATMRRGDFFLKGIENLLSPAGKQALGNPEIRAKAEAIVDAVLAKGQFSFDVCYRLQGAISELQKLGLELPPQINCFVQSMTRLQNSVAEMNSIINQSKTILSELDNYSRPPQQVDDCDLLGQILQYSSTAEGKELVKAEDNDDDDDDQVPRFVDKIENEIKGDANSVGAAATFQPGGELYEKVYARLNGAADPTAEAGRLFDQFKNHLDPVAGLVNGAMVEGIDQGLEEFRGVYANGDDAAKEKAIKNVVALYTRSTAKALGDLTRSATAKMEEPAEPPASFAGIIMNTLFNDAGEATDLINNTFAGDSLSLAKTAREIATTELGLGTFASFIPSNVIDSIVNDTKNMGGDKSYQIDIGI